MGIMHATEMSQVVCHIEKKKKIESRGFEAEADAEIFRKNLGECSMNLKFGVKWHNSCEVPVFIRFDWPMVIVHGPAFVGIQ